ncbi:MAG: flippase [Rhodospirillales bacterium]|nr:flippase [Rhodospirillales bacterium]
MSPDRRVSELTATRTIAISTAWNLSGRIFPLLIAVAVTPFLLHAMGLTRWGIFSLSLALMSAFTIFDLGLARALTRTIAHAIANGEDEAAAEATKTGIVVLAGLGVVFAVIIALGLHLYVGHALKVPPALRPEVMHALDVLCLALPLVVVNGSLWGVLSAYQRVGTYTIINMPILVVYYLGPLATLAVWHSLVPVMAVQVVCRGLTTIILWRLAHRAMPSLARARISFRAIRPVLHLGGWMTVSNLAFPILLYMDRFVIASVLSPAATAWYATPFDIIFRFTALPQAVMAAAFPAMTTAHRAAPARAALLYRRVLLAVGALVLPVALVAVTMAEPLLRLWLGAAFAQQAAPVLRLLGFGILFYSLDIVAADMLDGLGKPAFNARLALLEIAILVPLLLVLLPLFGVVGAAASWVARVALSFGLRVWLLVRIFPETRAELLRVIPVFALSLLALIVAVLGPVAAGAALLVVATFTWTRALNGDERTAVLVRLKRVPAA